MASASSSSTSFAQPSGISLAPDFKEAYIADSESSSIRALDLRTGGSRLLAGGDPVFSDNLFKFGDHDGVGSEVLLQHPLGVFCGNDGQIYLTDSYNHKIKKLDLGSRRVSTIAGNGKAGFKDGSALEAQEAQSKFSVEKEPENAASVDPLDGNINPEGSAVVQFKRSSASPSKTRIYCKVYYCKEDEVCLYEPLMFEISFKEGIPDASPMEISLTHVVKPKSPTFTSPTPVARQ